MAHGLFDQIEIRDRPQAAGRSPPPGIRLLWNAYRWISATPDCDTPQVRERLIRSIFERRAVVVFGAVTSAVSAITAVIITGAVWPYFWLIAEAILFATRMRGLGAAGNSSPEQAERCYARLVFLGIAWGTVFGLGSMGMVSSGNPLLIVLASINVAGAVGNIASRNAPLPRFGVLVMAATCIPFGTAHLIHGPSEMWVALVMGPVWVVGMIIVMLQNHDIMLRMILAERENYQAARTDGLTGLPNRIALEERLTELCRTVEADRPRTSFAVLCLDLDGFKPVNDAYGHLAGDKILCAAAGRIRNAVRDVDAAYRLGGDEFVVLLPATSRAEAVFVGSIILAALARPFEAPTGDLVNMGVSIGSTIADTPGLDPRQLIDRADRALYAAKAAGRGVYRDCQTGTGG